MYNKSTITIYNKFLPKNLISLQHLFTRMCDKMKLYLLSNVVL